MTSSTCGTKTTLTYLLHTLITDNALAYHRMLCGDRGTVLAIEICNSALYNMQLTTNAVNVSILKTSAPEASRQWTVIERHITGILKNKCAVFCNVQTYNDTKLHEPRH